MSSEYVLTIARGALPRGRVNPWILADLAGIPGVGMFEPREALDSLLEHSHEPFRSKTVTARVQFIPYTVVMARAHDRIYFAAAYRNAKDDGESLLHGKLKLGWGGHLNTSDAMGHSHDGPASWIRNCINRELQEELFNDAAEIPYAYSPIGVIRPTPTVGTDVVQHVHIGYVTRAILPPDKMLNPEIYPEVFFPGKSFVVFWDHETQTLNRAEPTEFTSKVDALACHKIPIDHLERWSKHVLGMFTGYEFQDEPQ